jgi:hypothetical protein
MAQWPAREIAVDLDTALMAQDAGMAGLMAGKVEWTEAEFSSFLTYLVRQNTGANTPVDSIMTWFEPDNKIFIRVMLKDGVMLGSSMLDLAGSIMVQDNQVMVMIDEAGANGWSAGGLLTAPVSDIINSVLASPAFGVAVNVQTDTGKLMLGM